MKIKASSRSRGVTERAESLNGALAQICLPTEGIDNTAVTEAAKAQRDGEKLADFNIHSESLTQMQPLRKMHRPMLAVRGNIGAAQNNLSSVNLSDMEAAANASAREQAVRWMRRLHRFRMNSFPQRKRRGFGQQLSMVLM
ncbi:MAG: hypothetical protein ACLSFZ_11555 [Frisingicoccus sp.]